MEDKRLEELLFEIGNEPLEPREELIIATKERIKYKPLIYLIPASVLLNIIFGGLLSIILFKNFNIKTIMLMVTFIGTLTNTIICLLLLNKNNINTHINGGGF